MDWNAFDITLCITLEGQLDRQLHTIKELKKVGINRFRFIYGIKADSTEVTKAFIRNQVSKYPPCFRCGEIECDCENNVLIREQVACHLSYMKAFRIARRSRLRSFLLIEDDVIFRYTECRQLRKALSRSALTEIGLFNKKKPCLLSMGSPWLDLNSLTQTQDYRWSPGDGTPSNYCFAFNRSFATLAIQEGTRISTTSDIMIHRDLRDKATCYGLAPRIASDLSWNNGTIPSLIHPKQKFIINSSDTHLRRKEQKRLNDHHKKVRTCKIGIASTPGYDLEWAIELLSESGYDIGRQSLGQDGIASWSLTRVSFSSVPKETEIRERNPLFIYPLNRALIVLPATTSIWLCAKENNRHPRLFRYRAKIINEHFDVNIAKIKCPIQQAVSGEILWYRLLQISGFENAIEYGDKYSLLAWLDKVHPVQAPKEITAASQKLKHLPEENEGLSSYHQHRETRGRNSLSREIKRSIILMDPKIRRICRETLNADLPKNLARIYKKGGFEI